MYMEKGKGKDESGGLDGGRFLKDVICHVKELQIYIEGPWNTLGIRKRR